MPKLRTTLDLFGSISISLRSHMENKRQCNVGHTRRRSALRRSGARRRNGAVEHLVEGGRHPATPGAIRNTESVPPILVILLFEREEQGSLSHPDHPLGRLGNIQFAAAPHPVVADLLIERGLTPVRPPVQNNTCLSTLHSTKRRKEEGTHELSGCTVAMGLTSGPGMRPLASADRRASSQAWGTSVGTTSSGG